MTTQEVWTEYSEGIKKFIVSKVKNPMIADDILQDTFIKIHTKLSSLKDITKLKSWIFSIAKNSILDHFKQQNKTADFDFLDIKFDEENEQFHTEKDCLFGILKGLPKKYRDPLFLSDIKGLKQQEVAKQLKQNLPTTKSQIQRARKMIAQGFKDCCGFTENEKGHLVGEIQDKKDCKVCS